MTHSHRTGTNRRYCSSAAASGKEAAVHLWVLTLADHMLGRGNILGISETIRKGPGLDTHPGLHTDYDAWRVEEPFPEVALECTAVWAIDDFDEAAGPTVFLPGSWKERRSVPPGTTRENCILLEMPKGSIAFWHGASWHGSQRRTAPGYRHSLHKSYLRYYMRPIERFDNIDSAIVDRNPPVFSALCGLDDLFGKSEETTGADLERYVYAAKNKYGSSSPIG